MSELVAQSQPGPFDPGLVSVLIVAVLAVGALCLVLIALIARQLKRCPSNRVLVIYGKTGPGEAAMCVHGGARMVIPLVQDYGWLSLEPIRVEVARQRTSSGRMIDDPLPRVFSVAIGTTPELMEAAAARLLGRTEGEIKHHAEDVIVAQLDRLLDVIESGEVQAGSDAYYQRLETSIGAELAKLGLVLINFRRE